MTTVAVIPARGGSKRLPKKNLADIHGHPMIAYSIGAACCAGCFDRIMVSTDDDDIRKVALTYGAEVIERPAVLAGDKATMFSAVNHAIQGLGCAWVAVLPPTGPLRNHKHIQEAKEAMFYSRASGAGLYTTLQLPLEHATNINQDRIMEPFWTRPIQPPRYIESEALYLVTVEAMRREHTLKTLGRAGVYVPFWQVVEVDYADDLFMARALLDTQTHPEIKKWLRRFRADEKGDPNEYVLCQDITAMSSGGGYYTQKRRDVRPGDYVIRKYTEAEREQREQRWAEYDREHKNWGHGRGSW